MRRAALLLFMLSILAMASLVSAVEPAPLAVTASQNVVVSQPALSPVLDPLTSCLSNPSAQVESSLDLEILSPQAKCTASGFMCNRDGNCCSLYCSNHQCA
jgi:hypothetical protein